MAERGNFPALQRRVANGAADLAQPLSGAGRCGHGHVLAGLMPERGNFAALQQRVANDAPFLAHSLFRAGRRGHGGALAGDVLSLGRGFCGKLQAAAPALHDGAPFVHAVGLLHRLGFAGVMAERIYRLGFQHFTAYGALDCILPRFRAGRKLVSLRRAWRMRCFGDACGYGGFAADSAELRPCPLRRARRFASCFSVAGRVALRGDQFTRGSLAANGASLHPYPLLCTGRFASRFPLTGHMAFRGDRFAFDYFATNSAPLCPFSFYSALGFFFCLPFAQYVALRGRGFTFVCDSITELANCLLDAGFCAGGHRHVHIDSALGMYISFA